ncbi:MAG TPA: DUF2269 family protein [Solirubrobacterales bacterium]|jgi:hypothetical protein
MLATITAYGVGLFIHILAVVLAFGPTFGYGFFFSVVPEHPRATPAILAGIQKVDRYLSLPGALVVLVAGIYVMAKGSWDGGELFIVVGFIAILLLLGLQHAFFVPQVRRARALAERDLADGGTLSDEFTALGQRIGRVGSLAGLAVVVTIFFMTVKP